MIPCTLFVFPKFPCVVVYDGPQCFSREPLFKTSFRVNSLCIGNSTLILFLSFFAILPCYTKLFRQNKQFTSDYIVLSCIVEEKINILAYIALYYHCAKNLFFNSEILGINGPVIYPTLQSHSP